MKKDGLKPMEHIARIIVDRRNLFLLFYIIAIVFCLFSMKWVKVEEDIVYYLSEDSKTRQGITIMNEEFTTFGTANIMVSNISYIRAGELAEEIGKISGVSSVMFENTADHYKNTSALMVVLFDGEDFDEISIRAMEDIREVLEPFDVSVSTTVGADTASQLTKDMTVVGYLPPSSSLWCFCSLPGPMPKSRCSLPFLGSPPF